jgi:two-component system cell cycle response regulator
MSAQILVVDDTADNLTLMVYLLRAAGHETLAAATGEQALAQSAANLPDLIMLDVQLPDIDGYTVLARMREDERLAKVPVIAVTAYAMVGDRDHALAAGFDGYLAKPIDPYTFAAAVDVHLPAALRGCALPARTHAPGVPVAAPKQNPPAHTTVLAVDDSSINLSLLRSVLEPHGYGVKTARTLRAAIEALGAERPDMVLSDVHIGSKSGAELRAFMRADPDLATLPFAFLTATASAGEQVVPDEPQVRIIHRPIEPSQLLRELAAILGSK